jgi:Tol biopolymer transport system component
MSRLIAVAVCLSLILGCQSGPSVRDGRDFPGTQERSDLPDNTVGSPYKALQHNSHGPAGTHDSDPDVHIDGEGKAHLVFASDSQAQPYHIFMKTAGGRGVTQLTFGRSNNRFPVWSPDGKMIAFCSDRTGSWDIWIIPDVSRPHALWPVTKTDYQDEIAPSWSRDGKKLVYSARDKAMGGAWMMWISDLDNGLFMQLGEGLFPKWTPPGADEDMIVFQKPRRRDARLYGIWMVDPDGNAPREIVADHEWAAINPTWSPNGKWIAFSTVMRSHVAILEHRITEADDIWYIRADGSGVEVQLTERETPEWMPSWGDDGRIYFVSKRAAETRAGRAIAQNIWSLEPILFDDLFEPADNTPIPAAEQSDSTDAAPE